MYTVCFNVGPNMQRIKMFYTNIVSCVTVNGNLSDWFYIHRGCRQGDILSPYLFIVCAEILTIVIKYNNIKGIKAGAEYSYYHTMLMIPPLCWMVQKTHWEAPCQCYKYVPIYQG